MKTLLIGGLVASPALVYWVGWADLPHGGQSLHQSVSEPAPSLPAAEAVVSIPVEVIATGSAPKWIYVQVGNQGFPNRE